MKGTLSTGMIHCCCVRTQPFWDDGIHLSRLGIPQPWLTICLDSKAPGAQFAGRHFQLFIPKLSDLNPEVFVHFRDVRLRFITGCWLFWSPMFGCCWLLFFMALSWGQCPTIPTRLQASTRWWCFFPTKWLGDVVEMKDHWMWTKTINLWEINTMWLLRIMSFPCGELIGRVSNFVVEELVEISGFQWVFVLPNVTTFLKKNKPYAWQVCEGCLMVVWPHFWKRWVFSAFRWLKRHWVFTVNGSDLFGLQGLKKVDGFTGVKPWRRLPKQHGIWIFDVKVEYWNNSNEM